MPTDNYKDVSFPKPPTILSSNKAFSAMAKNPITAHDLKQCVNRLVLDHKSCLLSTLLNDRGKFTDKSKCRHELQIYNAKFYQKIEIFRIVKSFQFLLVCNDASFITCLLKGEFKSWQGEEDTIINPNYSTDPFQLPYGPR